MNHLLNNILIACIFLFFNCKEKNEAKNSFLNNELEIKNPILKGFYPDPSIVKVENDYFLVNSTFSYFPGLPVFHNTDLVNWKQIGHVMDRVNQLNLNGVGCF